MTLKVNMCVNCKQHFQKSSTASINCKTLQNFKYKRDNEFVQNDKNAM